MRSKEATLNAGELSARSFRDYLQTCQKLIEQFGKERRVDDLRPENFRDFRTALAKRYGVTSLKNEINRCCIVFNYAHGSRLIDKPVNYGQNFYRQFAKTLRRQQNAMGRKLFGLDEVRLILAAVEGKPVRLEGEAEPVELPADPSLKAMVLLGINCGFGNTDVALLPIKAIDLNAGWATFPRPKTEIARRVPLWPETVAALQEAIASRPHAADKADAGLCFLTRQGRRWVRIKAKDATAGAGETVEDEQAANGSIAPDVPIDALSQKFSKILTLLKITGRRGLGFFANIQPFHPFKDAQ